MSSLPEPDEKVQPLRVVAEQEAMKAQARAGGVDDLVEFRAFYCGDVLLYGALAGPEDGPPLVLLHGFPDFWLGWGPLIRPLVEAGYRLIMPDQRGYNLSEKPGAIDDYQLPRLGGDIVGLLDALDLEDAHLVGHDWGGAVAWWLAEHHAPRFRSVAILNCPHSAVLAKALRGQHLRQMGRSWYIAFFQLPLIPEKAIEFGNFRMLVGALEGMSRQGAFSADEIAAYRQAWSQPKALTSMLNWYRAARRAYGVIGGGNGDGDKSAAGDEPRRISPIHVIWGKRDKALDASLVAPSVAPWENARVTWVDDGGHWVHRDRPQQVLDALLESLAKNR